MKRVKFFDSCSDDYITEKVNNFLASIENDNKILKIEYKVNNSRHCVMITYQGKKNVK